MGKISISGINVPCTIGVHAWEQQIKQKLLIDLNIIQDFSKAAKSDDLTNTIDYTEVVAAIHEFANKPFILLEAFASQLADALAAKFSIQQLDLKVTKPGAIPNVGAVAVEVDWKK